MKTEIRLLIADDHPIVRQGLRQIIETDPTLKIVAEVGDGAAALKQIQQTGADIAILDVNMPQQDGLAVAREVRRAGLPTAVVFLTMHDDETSFNLAMDAGAQGYVLKESAIAEIITCIKTVHAGRHYISPQLTTYLVNRGQRAASPAGETATIQQLTATERRLLKLLAEYKTSQEIADDLCISVRTVNNHRAHIAEKLHLQGSHALLKFAIEHLAEL
jgi:DNA-binding NarL/FixJ family response regulator